MSIILRFPAIVGFGLMVASAAQSSPVTTSYDLATRLEAVRFVDVEVFDDSGAVNYGTVDQADYVWGFDRWLPRLTVGDASRFVATFVTDGFGYLESLTGCSFAGFDCAAGDVNPFVTADADSVAFDILEGITGYDYTSISGGTEVGDRLRLSLFDAGPTSLFSDPDVLVLANLIELDFRVTGPQLSADPLLPVPVPAGLVLLPMGLAAFGFARRRPGAR
ncbi:hypothetical protein R5H30_16630 [Sulfitobacter sp. D35]|uniref:hypothetical protein n=1 Tax=Sulfitobacter sp. D35 TaxID=3083252 RepID=UPI00296F44FE|nr:hypothetical protein [Sulfitobacter sp. D35]MDW4499621.1 hypothetical protein [Sulfitobacter sp. D35]